MGAAQTVASEIEPANPTLDVEEEECSGHDRSPEGGTAVCKTKAETDSDHEFHADTDAGEKACGSKRLRVMKSAVSLSWVILSRPTVRKNRPKPMRRRKRSRRRMKGFRIQVGCYWMERETGQWSDPVIKG